MSFLTRMLPGGSGGGSPKDEQSARQEAVERLCSRLLHASLLEDRRSAAQALKSVAKHYQLEIGTIGIPTLIAALKRDSEDVEMAKSIMETFTAICSCSGGDGENDLYQEFSEILLKDKEVISLILSSLEDRNQYLKFDVLQLLQVLEKVLPAKLPASILSSPSGLSKLLELLEDDREIIRNETILLLRRLTINSPEIQKISVFEGTFERTFELVKSVGGVFSGDVLVEDVFFIVHNLLRHNPLNQNYFLESPCLSTISELLRSPHDHHNVEWNNGQNTRNFLGAVEILCILLDRESPKLFTVQSAIYRTGVFESLASFAMSTKSPNAARAKSLESLDRLMGANKTIQEVFARHLVSSPALASPLVSPLDSTENPPSLPPIPAVLAVIKMAVENENLELRLAATNMIAAYLKDNLDGQLVIAATFRSPRLANSPALNEQSAGSVIIEKALDLTTIHRDPYRVWFPTILLSHILRDNDQCKMIALNHYDNLTEEDDETTNVTLFSRIIWNLTECVKDPRHLHSSTAYLVLLSTWIRGFPPAASSYLAEGSNVQFLIELINQNSTADPMIQGCAAFLFGLIITFHDSSPGPFSRQSLIDIVKSRIGIDVFTARIIRTRNSQSAFLATGKRSDDPILYDRLFAEFFLGMYDTILSIFSSRSPERGSERALEKRPTSIDKGVETEAKVKGSAVGVASPSSDHTLQFELESLRLQIKELQVVDDNDKPFNHLSTLHDKNLESKCAYLTSENNRLMGENERLKKSIEMYSSQLLEIEQDHEDLLTTLATYDNELKQLRQHLSILEDNHPPFGLATGDYSSQIDLNVCPPEAVALESPVVISSIPTGSLYQIPITDAPAIDETIAAKPSPSTPTLPVKKLQDLLSSNSPSTSTQDV